MDHRPKKTGGTGVAPLAGLNGSYGDGIPLFSPAITLIEIDASDSESDKDNARAPVTFRTLP